MNLKNVTYEYEHHDCIFYQIALGIDYYHRELGRYSCIENGKVWHDDYFEECRFERAAINTACYLMAAYDCEMLEPKGEGFGCIKATLFDVNNSINELYSLDGLKFHWKGTAKSLAALLYMAFGTLSISGKSNDKGEITSYSIKSERKTIRKILDSEKEIIEKIKEAIEKENEEKIREVIEEELKKFQSHSDFLTKYGEYFDVPNLRNSAKQLAPLRDQDSEKNIKLPKEVKTLYDIQERAKAYMNELTYLEKIKSALQKVINSDLEYFKRGCQVSKLQEIKDYVVENAK